MQVRPIQGAAAPTGRLYFSSAIDEGSLTDHWYLSSDGKLLWAVDGAGTIGASFGSRPSTVFVKTSVDVGDAMFLRFAAEQGLGTTRAVDTNTAASILALLHRGRTDAASNIVIASVYDRGAASITNAATMRIHSFGWTNDSDVYDELAYVRADGVFYAAEGFNTEDAHNIGTSTGSSAVLGLDARNTTVAAAGAQQYSPVIRLGGEGWKTDATAESQEVDFYVQVRPVQGTTAPTGNLYFSSAIDEGSLTDHWYINSSSDLLCATDGSGDIGASAANRPGNVYVGGVANPMLEVLGSSAGLLSVGRASANQIQLTINSATGFDTLCPVLTTQNSTSRPLILYNDERVDAVDAVVIASVYDRNAASITNAATMRIHTFGWTDNSDTYGELAAVFANGDLMYNKGANAQSSALKSLTESVTIAAAAFTDTTIQIPADAIAYAASVRVTTAIPTATTFDVGIAGATTLYATGVSVALNTTDPGTASSYPTPPAAATSIRITPDATPGAATGVVRVTIHYFEVDVPTS
jgi:hypothetical protein